MTRDDWAIACRSLIGTPYSHAGRCPQVGTDCGGVVICAAKILGLPVKDRVDYSPVSLLHVVLDCAPSIADEFDGPLEDADFALVMWPQIGVPDTDETIQDSGFHLMAILPEKRIVHIHYGLTVCEEDLPKLREKRILKKWRIRAIQH